MSDPRGCPHGVQYSKRLDLCCYCCAEERDRLRAERDQLQEALANLLVAVDRLRAVQEERDRLRAERYRLREALEEIAKGDHPWGMAPAIARRALGEG